MSLRVGFHKSYDKVQLQKKDEGGGHVLVKSEERWGNFLAVIERSSWVRRSGSDVCKDNEECVALCVSENIVFFSQFFFFFFI